ncbi:endoglucanase A precursor [Clathrospora elynae]|uniref:Endoglucanase A n=1 Tax=Clathrospora elynae TaxID=706981 RepID=A0A6A5ST65_9PLEO|nr:endoglucanase A precursor [Clathrospora elynae]
MRLTTLLTATAASLALAAPTQKRADYCGQWDNTISGPYTVYNNLWGRGDATSGSQCTGVDGLKGSTLKWHTSWSWTGGAGHVKSYANVVTKINQKALSAIKTLPSTWSWSYAGADIVADVSYDLFTGSTATGAEEYEVMIWLAGLGGAGPISATGQPVATVTLEGQSWKLYNGKNGQVNVFSFVAEKQVTNFKGDLMVFFSYLTSKQGVPKTQILQSVGAGTEPFSGSNAKLSVSAYSLTQT